MNEQAIQEQIDNELALIAAHNEAIAGHMEKINRLRRQQGEKKKQRTGVGAVAVAKRIAWELKQAEKAAGYTG